MKHIIWARFLIIIVLVFSLTACGQAATKTQATSQTTNIVSDTTSINDVLQPILVQYQIPAIAAVVISHGKIVAQGAVGVRKFGDTTPVTIDDQFQLGSCTKAMTATVIAMLVEQGKLSWTTTMAEIYPELKDQMLPKYQDVTILELLSHHAGLPSFMNGIGYPPGTDSAYWYGLTEPITQQRYEYTKGFLCQPDSPEVDDLPEPGTEFLYSNVGYVIVGAVAEKVTGKSWEDLITTLIFQPLAMTTAGFGPMRTDNQVDQPWQHAYSNGQITPIPPGSLHSDAPPVFGPAGMVHVSVKDWAKFIVMHLEGEKGGSTLLKPASFKVLHTPPFDTVVGYALGWVVESGSPWTDEMMLTHTGSNGLNLAMVWMLSESDFAVLVTTNIASLSASSACYDAFSILISKFLPAN